MKINIKYACSLGFHCFSACVLKRNKIKLASYPFDWIRSTPKMVLHCIEDDFAKFLDKQYYSLTDNSTVREQTHIYYMDKSIKLFTHRNPLLNIDYEYFLRCVDRFRKLLKFPEKKLFIITIQDRFVKQEHLWYKYHVATIDNVSKTDMINFNNELKKYTHNYALLCIFNSTGLTKFHKFTSYENIDFLDFQTIKESTGVDYIDSEDSKLLNELIKKKYNFDF